MENKEQLQDILKSMANLLNQGSDSSFSYFPLIFLIGVMINR